LRGKLGGASQTSRDWAFNGCSPEITHSLQFPAQSWVALSLSFPSLSLFLTAEDRYRKWLVDKQAAGGTCTVDQRKWLDAIKDHVVRGLASEQGDLDEAPFGALGDSGRTHELFGEQPAILPEELKRWLAAKGKQV
jgi:hypothetical protein